MAGGAPGGGGEWPWLRPECRRWREERHFSGYKSTVCSTGAYTEYDGSKSSKTVHLGDLFNFSAALSLILVLVAFNYANGRPLTQALLINLATDLAGVFIIFVIVDQLFAVNDQPEFHRLTQQVDELRKEIARLGNRSLKPSEEHSALYTFHHSSSQEWNDVH